MWPAIFLGAVNTAILVAYGILERSPPPGFGPKSVAVVVLFLLTSLLAAKFAGARRREFVANIQLSLLACLIGAASIEAAFRMAPGLFPDNVRRLVAAGEDSASVRPRVVELLPHSPFAKPRANTLIHIPGYYGPKEYFVYEWTTDRRGFKNTPEVAARESVEVLALGDSFTEGMGVRVEDTWTSRLSARGVPAYSLGVQGYAPAQFVGAYERYGRALKPRWVVVGYTGDVFLRNSHFRDAGKPSGLPSAIGRLVERDEIEQQRPIYMEMKDGYRIPVVLRAQSTFVTSAIVSLAQQTLRYMTIDISAGTAPDDARFITDKDIEASTEYELKLMARYRGELRGAAQNLIDANALATDPLWLSAEKDFETIVAMARQDGARVLFLFFPNRSTAYYQRATGKPLPATISDHVQAALLARFAERNGAAMIDMTPVFRDYVAKLTDANTIEDFPYLRVDGHPSPKGHELIAGAVAHFLAAPGTSGR